jgi:hypothetical protein
MLIGSEGTHVIMVSIFGGVEHLRLTLERNPEADIQLLAVPEDRSQAHAKVTDRRPDGSKCQRCF